MNKPNNIPIIILNGFLGSGKTTLLRNLLYQSKKKNIPISVIVNDMSELDVDAELLKREEIVEEKKQVLSSIYSCVLSSKQGIKKLDQAIKKIITNQKPELIIIETSGSCHPLPLIEYFKKQKQVCLTGVLTLVDSLMLTHDYEGGKSLLPQLKNNLEQGKRNTLNLLIEQIMFCSHLILTKADRLKKGTLEDIAVKLHEINPFSLVCSVFYGKLNIETLLGIQKYDYYRVAQLIQELKPELECDHHGDRPYDLATRVIKDQRPFHPERLWLVCQEYLDPRIYRSKGFFWLASRNKDSLLWNQAAGSISLELIGTWRSAIIEDPNHGLSSMEITMLKEQLAKQSGDFGDRKCDLTIIGDKEHVDAFTQAIQSCFLTEEEVILWKKDTPLMIHGPKA